MGTVLEDVTSETIDAEHIRRHVDDWEQRLRGLFAAVGGWLPDGWEVRQSTLVVMDEPLMRKFGGLYIKVPIASEAVNSSSLSQRRSQIRSTNDAQTDPIGLLIEVWHFCI